MDLPLLASTFATVFLAELGDKTQLAIVTISGTSSRSGAVFAGSSLALVLASLLGAAAGGSLSSVIGPDVLRRIPKALAVFRSCSPPVEAHPAKRPDQPCSRARSRKS